uniref:Uncharacterized protein n=1 Tax=Panagrolaimus davidi TaxID=227884 RepID=A0A914QVY7_9BILA
MRQLESYRKPSAPFNIDSDEDVKVNGNLIKEKEIVSDVPIDIDSSDSEAPIVIASRESDVSLEEKVKSSFAAGDSCIKIDDSYDEILKGITFFGFLRHFYHLH